MSLLYIGYTKEEMKTVLNDQISLSYVSVTPESDDDVAKVVEAMDGIGLSKSRKIYSGLWQYEILSLLYNGDIPNDEIENYRISIDGDTYIGVNDNSNTFGIDEKNATPEDIRSTDKAVYFGIKILGGEKPIIATDNELKEFRNKYPDDGIIIYGNSIENKNDVMISDYMLEKFGVKEDDFSDMIGKKISISFIDKDDEVVLIQDSVLCGILSQNFFRVEKERYSAQVFVDAGNSSFESIENFNYQINADVSEFNSISQYANQLSDLKIGDVFYDEQTTKIYSDLEMEKEIISSILSLVVIVITIAFIVNIYYIQNYQIQRKKYFFGLISAIGMHRSSIRKLLFSELCFVALSAAILSEILSFILYNAIATYTDGMFSSNLFDEPLQFVFPGSIVLLSAPIISYAITLYNTAQLNKENLVALLNKSTID
jgi:ABC-type antimicrobial peptide transport system permease subunit